MQVRCIRQNLHGLTRKPFRFKIRAAAMNTDGSYAHIWVAFIDCVYSKGDSGLRVKYERRDTKASWRQARYFCLYMLARQKHLLDERIIGNRTNKRRKDFQKDTENWEKNCVKWHCMVYNSKVQEKPLKCVRCNHFLSKNYYYTTWTKRTHISLRI